MNLDLDKRTWKRVVLSDVVRHVTDRVDAETSGLKRFLAGEHIPSRRLAIRHWGIVGKDPMGPMFYKRFQPGHVLYVSRRTYLRKVAVPDFEGITGEKTFVLETCEPDVLIQEFLPFLLSAERFHSYAIANSHGSVNPYLNWGELATYEFDLPPLEEQQRIADLLWSIERHRGVLKCEEQELEVVLVTHARAQFASVSQTRRLGDLATTRSGPSFPAKAVTEHQEPGSVPVLGIPNTKPDGTIDLHGVGYVSGLPSGLATVDEDSLILIRTNGNRDRIGNVYLPPAAANGYAVSAFQFLMKMREPADREYLYWFLRQPTSQQAMSGAASGTTGLGNLAVKWLNEFLIPWPNGAEERGALTNALRAVASALEQVRAEGQRVSALGDAVSAIVFGGAE